LSSLEISEKQYDLEVKVNNLQTEEQYIWDRIKFKERLIVMRDLLNFYETQGDVEGLAHEDNPFTDVPEPAIIGEGYYRLEPLSFLIDNPSTIDLIGSNYENHGNLEVDVVPVDPNGDVELADEDLPEVPEDLIQRRVDYLVKVIRAKNLPTNFCRDVFVEY